MKWDAASFVKKYDQCQRHTPIHRVPLEALTLVTSPWSFAQQEMDIIDPLPIRGTQNKFLFITTDYFNKQVEAKAYVSIEDKDISKFVQKNIVCRFGIPPTIVTDNGLQFDSVVFQTFCLELNIENLYSTLCYSQSNRKTEAKNKTLLNALKKILEGAKEKWVDELLGVLWANRTKSRRPTGTTPFALTYGMEAIIPTTIGMPIAKTVVQDQKDNNEELIRQLDWTDKKRGNAAIQISSYHQMAIAQYNKMAQPRFFRPRSLVLRRVFENTAKVGAKSYKIIGKDHML